MLVDGERHQIPTVLIKGKDVPVTFIRSSFFYYLHISDCVPAAQKRWQDEGINFGDDWAKMYNLAFDITSSTKLQSLQYRILHRYWPTRKYLCIRNIVDDPFCDYCGVVETLEHCLFYCSDVELFLGRLEATINLRLSVETRITLTAVEVIFGNPKRGRIINLIILVAKQFILQQRYRDKPMTIDIFRQYLLKMFHIEKTNAYLSTKIENFRRKWQPFISEVNELLF